MSEKKWYDALPRPEFSAWERIPVETEWFWVYKLPGEVYAIAEPGQWQEVISFLVIGGSRAALIDTGIGVGDIRAVVKELTLLPVFVINTHFHWDHTGGNWQFDECYNIQDSFVMEAAKNGVPHSRVASQVEGDAVWQPLPAEFVPEEYCTKPWNSLPMKDGDEFDIGGRQLRIVAAPGHTGDCVFIYDDLYRCLFTGDNIYPAPIYLHMGGGPYSGLSDIDAYAHSLRENARYARRAERLFCSHNVPCCDTSLYFEILDGVERIQRGELPGDHQDGACEYKLSHCSIITK